MGLDILARHHRIGVDTSPFIYLIEATPIYFDIAYSVFEQIHTSNSQVITSTITITELLTKPYLHGDSEHVVQIEAMMRTTPGLTILDVSVDIAREAARLRAAYALKTPDALQIATALAGNSTAFFTNDARLNKVKDLEVIQLSDLMS